LLNGNRETLVLVVYQLRVSTTPRRAALVCAAGPAEMNCESAQRAVIAMVSGQTARKTRASTMLQPSLAQKPVSCRR